ncbi:MAG: hypothetical protein QOH53_1349 [Ilumatobacteraceae bacterium]|jgi:hypothetical protein
MTDTNDNRPLDERTRDAARDADERAREAGRDAKGKARNIGQRVSDAVEDVIPGDSDRDGH